MTLESRVTQEVEKALGQMSLQMCVANATINSLQTENAQLRQTLAARQAEKPQDDGNAAAQDMLNSRGD